MFLKRSLTAALTILVLALTAVADAKPTSSPLRIDVLSNRADLISAGDALVAVAYPDGTDPADIHVSLGGSDITSEFAMRENGRYEGLVTGLALGANTLEAVLPDGRGAQITIVNHPNGGPAFSGPQVQPWKCQSTATDAQCNEPPKYTYQYMSSTTNSFQSYDPKNPPSDVATTTTDQGKTVPFITRTETGYQDRDQYQITILYDPSKPWAAWAPQAGWNHKLLITHGASCGIEHQSGTAPSTTLTPLPDVRALRSART